MNSLENRIKNFYQSQSLDESFIQELQNKSKKLHSTRLWRLLAIAALILLLAFPLSIFLQREWNVRGAASEIVKGHLAEEKVLFVQEDYALLQKNLSKLDFTIQPSHYIDGNEYSLVGGKYCSLRGEKAAQIKLLNLKNGSRATLYSAPLHSTLPWITETQKIVNGNKVYFWSEGSTVFGLVSQ